MKKAQVKKKRKRTELSAVWRTQENNYLKMNWRDAERMAQLLVTRHVASFSFIKMVLYLPCATQVKHLCTQIVTCVASSLYMFLSGLKI